MKTAYIHGRIHTRHIDAFLVEDGRFVTFGTTGAVLAKLGRGDAVIDLNGHRVLPGFHDSHMHVLGLGQSLRAPDVSGVKTVDGLVAFLKERLTPPALFARGFHESQLVEKRPIRKEDLDRVSTDIPVMLERVCGHLSVGNTKAIEAALQKETPAAQDANYDFEKGHFVEKDAIRWLYRPHASESAQAMERDILTAQAHLFAHGVTAVGSDDFSASDMSFQTVFDVFDALDRDGRLKLRVHEQANLPDEADLQAYLRADLHRHRGRRFRGSALKLLTDGSLGARSAYMKAPYADEDTCGVRVFDPEKLSRLIKTAHAEGMDVALHAIGDRAVEDILDVIETIPAAERAARRHSIIHVQCADRAQIERMRALNVGAHIQPVFIDTDLEIIKARLGERRFESYLFNTMMRSGLQVALGTDAPVEGVDPFKNLYVALTRASLKRPDLEPHLSEEALTLPVAIDAYTRGGAFFSYQEHELGRLAKGHHADFIVVDGFSPTAPESLKKTRVLQTYVGGECVFDRSDST